MASWDVYEPQLDEQQERDFVLKQPSRVGPWVVLVLGTTLVAFVGYLLLMNLLLPLSRVTPFEQTSRAAVEIAPAPVQSKRPGQRPAERRKATAPVIPQGRAPNALLGGHGPALLPEQVATPPLHLP